MSIRDVLEEMWKGVEAPTGRYRHTTTGRVELGTEPWRWRHSYCLSVVGEFGDSVWCFSWLQISGFATGEVQCYYPACTLIASLN